MRTFVLSNVVGKYIYMYVRQVLLLAENDSCSGILYLFFVEKKTLQKFTGKHYDFVTTLFSVSRKNRVQDEDEFLFLLAMEEGFLFVSDEHFEVNDADSVPLAVADVLGPCAALDVKELAVVVRLELNGHQRALVVGLVHVGEIHGGKSAGSGEVVDG